MVAAGARVGDVSWEWGAVLQEGQLQCGGAPGIRDGFSSASWGEGRDDGLSICQSPGSPNTASFPGLAPGCGNTDILRIAFCANTSFKPSTTSTISFSSSSSPPALAVTAPIGFCVCLHPPEWGWDVVNLGMETVTGTRWGCPSWSGQDRRAPVNSPLNMAINNFGYFSSLGKERFERIL